MLWIAAELFGRDGLWGGRKVSERKSFHLVFIVWDFANFLNRADVMAPPSATKSAPGSTEIAILSSASPRASAPLSSSLSSAASIVASSAGAPASSTPLLLMLHRQVMVLLQGHLHQEGAPVAEGDQEEMVARRYRMLL